MAGSRCKYQTAGVLSASYCSLSMYEELSRLSAKISVRCGTSGLLKVVAD